jgi:hypothetical protein
MLSCIFSVSVLTLSTTLCFFKTDVYKMRSCYCKRKTKRKVSSLLKLSEFYTIETSIFCCWGRELILSPVQMWLTPQPYRYWFFGCWIRWCRWWPLCLVYGILWLEHFTTVICHRLVGSPHFVCFVYGSCPMWHLYFGEPSTVM